MDVACHSLHVEMFLLGLWVHLYVHKVYPDLEYVYMCHVILSPLDMEDLAKQANTLLLHTIFVGIPDDVSGWLFYVPSAKMSYISLDVIFDESFTSPLVLPDLPYQGT